MGIQRDKLSLGFVEKLHMGRGTSNLHVVYPMELEDLRSIDYQKFELNI